MLQLGDIMIMTTETVAILPIIKALAQSIIFASGTQNISDTWYQQFFTTNPQQQILINTYAPAHKELSQFTQDELGAWASRSYEELNDILTSKEFDIRLAPFSPDGFGVVSILDIKTEWQHAGSPTTILCPDNETTYHGVAISKGYKVFSSANHEHPIAQLCTQSGDVIFLTKATKQQSGFELLQTVQNIKSNLKEIDEYNGKLIFPKACVNHQPDVSWLKGMSFDIYTIDQAKQQTKFNLNETGAEVKSAVAIGLMECAYGIKKDFIIDQPYIAWWERDGVSIPVVAALVAQDSWQQQ
jgi:hypothetical protein